MNSITRRRFAQLLAGVAGAAALPQVRAQTTGRTECIIVAGAGLGGLCCAYELMERGHEVTVVEASRWVGGHVSIA